MAEPVQNFRTAFHGFNREDVVRFLETATARHTAEVNQLQDDVARLEKELAALREQQTPEVSREELEALRGENTRLKAQIEELEAQLTEPEAPSAIRPTGRMRSWPPTAGRRRWSARPGTGRPRCTTGSTG
ncbi:MAG: hypothetical protein ACLSHU_14460 [Oscillospiraceae bacterium]